MTEISFLPTPEHNRLRRCGRSLCRVLNPFLKRTSSIKTLTAETQTGLTFIAHVMGLVQNYGGGGGGIRDIRAIQ